MAEGFQIIFKSISLLRIVFKEQKVLSDLLAGLIAFESLAYFNSIASIKVIHKAFKSRAIALAKANHLFFLFLHFYN